jgi:hypothetical protein
MFTSKDWMQASCSSSGSQSKTRKGVPTYTFGSLKTKRQSFALWSGKMAFPCRTLFRSGSMCRITPREAKNKRSKSGNASWHLLFTKNTNERALRK